MPGNARGVDLPRHNHTEREPERLLPVFGLGNLSTDDQWALARVYVLTRASGAASEELAAYDQHIPYVAKLAK
jgi:hypothetical protein